MKLFFKGLVLAATMLSTLAQGQEFLPPSVAFTPKLEGRKVTIKIADGYYLYQDKISVSSQGKPVKFTYITVPINKTFPEYGTYKVYLEQAKISIDSNVIAPITVAFQGCSFNGLCYPPQQVLLR